MREFKIRKVISVLLVFSIVFSLFSSLPTFVSDVYASSGCGFIIRIDPGLTVRIDPGAVLFLLQNFIKLTL